jgi:Predicted solute binding protein
MKYFNIKSIILGVGMGIFFTSATGMVYFNSIDVKQPMTKEEIVSKAKEFGLVEQSSILKPADTTPTPSATPTTAPTATPTATPKPTATSAPTLGPEVIVTVNNGDTAVVVAKKLYDNKMIGDQDTFINKMIDSKAAYKMTARQHSFRVGMTEEEIINELLAR